MKRKAVLLLAVGVSELSVDKVDDSDSGANKDNFHHCQVGMKPGEVDDVPW